LKRRCIFENGNEYMSGNDYAKAVADFEMALSKPDKNIDRFVIRGLLAFAKLHRDEKNAAK